MARGKYVTSGASTMKKDLLQRRVSTFCSLLIDAHLSQTVTVLIHRARGGEGVVTFEANTSSNTRPTKIALIPERALRLLIMFVGPHLQQLELTLRPVPPTPYRIVCTQNKL